MDQNINIIQNDLGYSLTISKDKMEAYIRPIETPPPEINADSIKNLLELEGISFGVVDDGRIAAYLASNPSMDKPWKIAKGMPVKSGRPPEIKCYFDTAPLKAGTIDEKSSQKLFPKKRGRRAKIFTETYSRRLNIMTSLLRVEQGSKSQRKIHSSLLHK